MQQIRIFLTALMFFTRIPCPSWIDHSEEYLNKSSQYFPLVGGIVGAIGCAVLFGALWVLPVPLAVLLSMVATVLATGAFHEDGFADMCDGFGGGWTKEKILDIMQDSRLGTFGAVGLGLLMTTKFLCLQHLTTLATTQARSWAFLAAVVLAGHTTSRFVAVTLLQTHEYARREGDSKSKPLATSISKGGMVFAGSCGIAPLLVFGAWKWLVLLLPLMAVKWWLGRFFTRWIGGYTGDCLGATQQVSEVTLYLCITGATQWNFC